MALVKCKECGQQISTKAEKCPSCGAKAPRKTSPVTWMVLVAILLTVYISVQSPSSPTSSTATASNSDDPTKSKDVSKEEEPPSLPEWRTFESEDEMTGERSAFATSPRSSSRRPMEFPYQGARAWLGVGCDKNSEWAYIGFTKTPNLNNTETKDGYNLINTRVKWDDSVIRTSFTQDWGADFLHFRADSAAIQRLMAAREMLLELDWHSQRPVHFPFTLRGSSKAIGAIREKCSNY